jgi:hypothetical protein
VQHSDTGQQLVGVDFADAQTGWAVGAGGTILATRNGGASWEVQHSSTDQRLLYVYFADAQTGWAVGAGGTILCTRNGGASWEPQRSGADQDLTGVHFADLQTGWAVGDGGTILATPNGGASWERQHGGTDKDLYAVHFADAQTGWTVGDGGTILATRNGGASWKAEHSGTGKRLMGVHFADAETGWAVGDGGTMLRAARKFMSPSIKAPAAVTTGDGEVDVSLGIARDGVAPIRKVSIEARSGEAPWASVGTASPGSDTRWHMTWKPTAFHIEKGSPIEYRVLIDDGGPPLPLSIGSFVFAPLDPVWRQLWRDHSGVVLLAFASLGILAIYLGYFAAMLWLAPAGLARLGPADGFDDVPKPPGVLGWIVGLARLGIEKLALPWFVCHPRVRRAWMKGFIQGKVRLDDLGAISRESFVQQPDVLDAWVEKNAHKARAAIEQLDLYRQRRVYVSLPVRVGEPDVGELVERPNPELARAWFKQPRAVVSILGGGGCGKSALACALARWAISDDEANRLLPNRMFPIFVLEETTNLVDAVSRALRRMLGPEELPADLVRSLLSTQRLLVIVDALSERGDATQQHVEKIFAEEIPINALIVTARREPDFGPVDRANLYPERLTGDRLIPFIFEYLSRSNQATLFAPRQQVQLGERVLALAEAGGKATAVTPLLAKLFVDSAIRRTEEGTGLQDMPQDVPEIFIDYLRRTHPLASTDFDTLISAARILAVVSVGDSFVPSDFRQDTAIAALSAKGLAEQAEQLIGQVVSNGVLERRVFGGLAVLRFSLDPAAEYLAAIEWIDRLRTDRARWEEFTARLRGTEGYPNAIDGFLQALSTCYIAYKQPLRLPVQSFPWDSVDGNLQED